MDSIKGLLSSVGAHVISISDRALSIRLGESATLTIYVIEQGGEEVAATGEMGDEPRILIE